LSFFIQAGKLYLLCFYVKRGGIMKFRGINHVALATGNMDRTIRFWRDLLGMRLIAGIGAQKSHPLTIKTPADRFQGPLPLIIYALRLNTEMICGH
jgi:hypothetical protein